MKYLQLLPFILLAGCSSSEPTTVADVPPPVVDAASSVAPPVAAPQPVATPVAPVATPVVEATPVMVDNGSSRNGINDMPPPVFTKNPFFFDASAMPNSVESALSAVDKVPSSDEIHRLLPYLSQARMEFRDREQQCGVTNRRCVIVYSLCQDSISGVYDYAQTKADGLDGRVMDIAARNGMDISARYARRSASLADDHVTGQAARNSQQTVRSMREMLENDSKRLQGR